MERSLKLKIFCRTITQFNAQRKKARIEHANVNERTLSNIVEPVLGHKQILSKLTSLHHLIRLGLYCSRGLRLTELRHINRQWYYHHSILYGVKGTVNRD